MKAMIFVCVCVVGAVLIVASVANGKHRARESAPAAFKAIGYTIIGETEAWMDTACFTASPTNGRGNNVKGCVNGSRPNEVLNLKAL